MSMHDRFFFVVSSIFTGVGVQQLISKLALSTRATMGTPVLHTYPLAYAPFKAALALAEKNVKYTPMYVDLFNGQSLSPQFLAVNPNGTVPVLTNGGTIITESRKIVEYINGLDPGPLGGSEADQQLAAAWSDKIEKWDGNLFMAANTDPGAAKLLNKLSQFKIRYAEARARQYPDLQEVYAKKLQAMKAADAAGKDPIAIAENESILLGILDDAEQQLAQTQYLAGSAYSVADVMFTPVLFRLGMAGKTGDYLKPRPKVSDYYNRMKERSSFQPAFEAATSKWTLVSSLVPALVKAQVAAVTGWY